VGDYTRLSDDELLRRTGEDREAFEVFYDRHVSAVLISCGAAACRATKHST
jgi:hypothetical protein